MATQTSSWGGSSFSGDQPGCWQHRCEGLPLHPRAVLVCFVLRRALPRSWGKQEQGRKRRLAWLGRWFADIPAVIANDRGRTNGQHGAAGPACRLADRGPFPHTRGVRGSAAHTLLCASPMRSAGSRGSRNAGSGPSGTGSARTGGSPEAICRSQGARPSAPEGPAVPQCGRLATVMAGEWLIIVEIFDLVAA